MPAAEIIMSTTEAKEKLKNLSTLMPDSPETVHQFGAYVADRLSPELVPMGFIMACELAIYDLQKGVDGFTGKPITNRLVGYPPMIYGLLRLSVPNIAATVFPAEFAAEVKAFMKMQGL